MKKETKKTIRKEFELFRINNKNIISINLKTEKKEYKIETFLTHILSDVGGSEYLTEISKEINTFKKAVKLTFEQKTLMFVFKHLRANGYPILLTDLFGLKDFKDFKLLLKKSNKIMCHSYIPLSYYRKLVHRFKEYLWAQNVKIKEVNEDELVDKISFKSKPVVLILNILIGQAISLKVFNYWKLNSFCSYETYRKSMYKLYKKEQAV